MFECQEHEDLDQRHRENQSLFRRQCNDSVTIEIVYLYQGLLVEQFSDDMESPCKGTTEETVITSENLIVSPLRRKQ